jgi:hypothetical protein
MRVAFWSQPDMLRDAVVTLGVLAVAAVLGVFVHPLLWTVAILAVAWLAGGRDPYTSASHKVSRSLP